MADGETEFPEFELEESLGSQQGQIFVGPGTQRLPNKGQRNVRMKLGAPNGKPAHIKFQEAKVRRAILSVGESTEAENMSVFGKVQSVMLPRGAPEIPQIRALIRQALSKLVMEKEKNTFYLNAWVDTSKGSRPFQRRGTK